MLTVESSIYDAQTHPGIGTHFIGRNRVIQIQIEKTQKQNQIWQIG